MIIRVEHRDRYTVITNQALRDGRLSYRATGLLAYVLSFTDDIVLTSERLSSYKREGRDAVRAALTELEKAGYLRREREQTRSGIWRTVCVMSEIPPMPGNPSSVTGSQPVTSHQPMPGKPTVGFPGPVVPSTCEEVLSDPPWEPASESRFFTAEDKIRGLAKVAELREQLGWKKEA